MKKFVLYTARFGMPGRYRNHKSSLPKVKRIYYTDVDIKEGCHQMIPVGKGKFKQNDFYHVKKMNLNHISIPIKRQRFVKICVPDELFNNYEYSVYVDIKRPFSVDFEKLLNMLEHKSDFLTRWHPSRDCAYDEAKWLIRKGRFDEANILKQIEFYQKEKFPTHNGLYWTTILFRRHTKRLKEFSRLWWEQIKKYSHRDQISLPYVAWKYNMKISMYMRQR